MARADLRAPGAGVPAAFAEAYEALARRLGRYEAWSAFVRVYAAEVAWGCGNRCDALMDRRESLAQGLDAAARGALGQMFDQMVEALEARPFQDFLGGAYMALGVADKGHGQFFTPFHISRAMARIVAGRAARAVEERGFASVQEPSCGAGASVIALAGEMAAMGLDWQRGLYFEARDISELPALMCYLQASLIGLAGHVVVGDTLKGEARMALHTPMMAMEPAWVAREMRGDVPWTRA